jgi:maltose/moltooligosaccharide transporter
MTAAAPDQATKPTRNWLQMVLMCVGFFGIQHGFEIQFANMSAIYQKLGVQDWMLSLLWLPAPLMGFFIAPIVGNYSDRAWWGWLGRRRGVALIGALMATVAMIWMPNTQAIWTAVLCLCLLDLSINMCMSPSRALLADQLPTQQLASGFAIQSFMVGLGGFIATWIASFDWLKHYPAFKALGSSNMHIQFYLCAAMFLVFILVTVLSTKEDKHLITDATPNHEPVAHSRGWLADMTHAVKHMPPTMQRVCMAQFFTWMGLFCFFMYYSVAVAKGLFHATDPNSAVYEQGILAANQSKLMFQIVSTVIALALPFLVKVMGRVWLHAGGLLLAGAGLLSVCLLKDPVILPYAMAATGVGWCCILTLPFALVSECVPDTANGVYMGLFNLFIVIPEILAALFFGIMVDRLFGGNELYVIGLGGIFMVIAASVMLTLTAVNRPAPGKQLVAV